MASRQEITQNLLFRKAALFRLTRKWFQWRKSRYRAWQNHCGNWNAAKMQMLLRRCQLFDFVINRVIFYNSQPHSLKLFSCFSESSSSAFPYCGEPGLNFSATNYSEDDADFAGNRRGKASRVCRLAICFVSRSKLQYFLTYSKIPWVIELSRSDVVIEWTVSAFS